MRDGPRRLPLRVGEDDAVTVRRSTVWSMTLLANTLQRERERGDLSILQAARRLRLSSADYRSILEGWSMTFEV